MLAKRKGEDLQPEINGDIQRCTEIEKRDLNAKVTASRQGGFANLPKENGDAC